MNPPSRSPLNTITSVRKNFLGARLRFVSAALLLLVLFPVAARAQLTNISYTTTASSGQITITAFSASGSGPLTIPNMLPDPNTQVSEPVVAIAASAFNENIAITSVTFPSSLTSIGAGAFYNCTNLTSVSFPGKLATIGYDAFEYCTSLTSAVFEGNAPTTGTSVFNAEASGFSVSYYGGSGFTSPTWTDSSGDAYPATNLGGNPADFATTSDGTGGLIITGYTGYDANLAIPSEIGGLNVTSIATSAFQGSTAIDSVSIPSKVTTIGAGAFSGCANLTAINVATANTVYSSDASGALLDKNQITFYQYPNGNPAQAYELPTTVTTVADNAFNGTANLVSVTIPVSVGTNGGSIGATVFANCPKLIAAAFLGNAPTIGANAFQNDSNGFSIAYYGGTNFTSPTWTDSSNNTYNAVNFASFFTTTADTNGDGGVTITKYTGTPTVVTVPSQLSGKNVNFIGSSAFYQLSTKVTVVTIAAGITSVGNSAFEGCSSMTYVAIPNSVNTFIVNAFAGCTGLTSVIIPASVINIQGSGGGGGAFTGCSGLTSVTLMPGLPSLGALMFANCGKLATITIPSSVTTIGDSALAQCSVLNNVTIPNSVTSFGQSVFSGDGSLSNITLPPNDPSFTSIPTGTFSECNDLLSVTIPSSVTSIGSSAFSSCPKLNNVTLPPNLTTINSNAFTTDTSLTSIAIPNSVTSLGTQVFGNCSALASVTIGSGLSVIPTNTFQYCTSLTGLTIPSTVTQVQTQAFADSGLTNLSLPDSVTTTGDKAFAYCPNLKTAYLGKGLTSFTADGFFDDPSLDFITVAATNPDYSSDSYGVLFNKAQTTLVQFPQGLGGAYTIPSTVTTIATAAFEYAANLQSVTIPASVGSIGDDAFHFCSSLTQALFLGNAPTMGENDFVGVATGFAVDYTTNSTGFTTPTWFDGNNNGSNTYPAYPVALSNLFIITVANNQATIVGYAGPGGAVTIPGTYNGLPVVGLGNGSHALSGNVSSITSVTIPDSPTGPTSLTLGGNVFNGGNAGLTFPSLTSVSLGSGVTSIGPSAFAYCYALTSVTIGSGVTSIGLDAFEGCQVLTAITVDPSNPDFSNDSSADGVLFNSGQTTLLCYPAGKGGSYTIPNSVTTIDVNAFLDSTYLTSLTLGSGVTTIPDGAFDSLVNVTSYSVDPNNPDFSSIGDGVLFNKNQTTLVLCPLHKTVSYTIPNTVTSIGPSAFAGVGGLPGVTIPSSVTSIGPSAFYYCANLTSVTIPNSVASIGNSAFAYTSLSTVTIPASVTSIGDGAFSDDGLTKTVFLGNAPTDAPSSGSGIFTGNANNFVVDYYSTTSGFTSGTWTDSYGHQYTSVNLGPLYNTASDGNGGLIITGYNGPAGGVLIPSTIPDPTTGAPDPVTGIGDTASGDGAFQEIDVTGGPTPSTITSVIIPNSVTSIAQDAFLGCASLSSVTLGNSVATIGAAAFDSDGLTSITIPASVTSIGNNAFNMPSLVSATFLGNAPTTGGDIFGIPPGANNFSVVYFGGATGFTSPTWTDSYGDSYPTVSVGNPADFQTSPDGHGGLIITGYLGAGGAVGIPSTLNGLTVTSIGQNAFGNVTSLTSVEISQTVTSIAADAFYGCANLTSATIPTSVTTIASEAFQNCSSLASVTLPPFLSSIGDNAFYGCSSLTTVNIPGSVTSIGNGPFARCANLASITVDQINFSYTSVGGVLFDGLKTTVIQYPAALAGAYYTIPSTVTTIGFEAFFGNTNLIGVNIPASVTNIGASAFNSCTNLTNAVFEGNAPTTTATSIFAFNASNFEVTYGFAATGFASPTWTDSFGNQFPARVDPFGGLFSGGNGLKKSSWFGHYVDTAYPLVYQYGLGYEYVYPTSGGGVYLFDYPTGHFWYTQSSYYPFLYDFSQDTFIYYYQANTPHRHFYSYFTNSVITE